MAKCQCRWNCDHGSAYGRSNDDPDCEGLCKRTSEGNFIRFTCPGCSHFRVYEICDTCMAQLERYLKHDAACHCENCRVRFHAKEVWSLYQDKEV